MAILIKVGIILSLTLFVFSAIEVAGKIIAKVMHWHRRRRRDARIIAQAKAAGVWDKVPIVLGGRALELKAWEDFKIKREPGEKDIDLRARYMMKQIEEDFRTNARNLRKPTKKKIKELTEKVKRIAAKHGYNNIKVKNDGYNIEVTLYDETVPDSIEVKCRTETGGQSNE